MARSTLARPRARLVPRPRLVQRLRGSDVPLALLVAPAGYGKSTVLAQWAERDSRPFAWLVPDSADNDPQQLVASIGVALTAAGVVPARREDDTTLAALLESLQHPSHSFVLAIDDLQVLEEPESLGMLTAIVDHLPWGSQLALASRSEPGMPVGRLRARRKVVEVRHGDLALASSEARALLSEAGLTARATGPDVLTERAEGWAAGLYLSALIPDDSDGPVADFVRDEIFSALSAEELAFLTRVAVLDRLSGPVCDGVLERTGSARLLSDLARSNVPLFAEGGADCYRLNPLMAQTLRAELRRSEPETEDELHRRAAIWFAARGDVDTAARHAVSAGDAALTGRVLWPNVLRYVAFGRNADIQRWLGEFREEDIASDPELSLVAACSWLALGDRNRAEHWTSAVTPVPAGSKPRGAAPTVVAGVAIMRAAIGRQGIAAMGDEAARAYELFPDGSPWLAGCCLLRGVASHLTGELDAARSHLEEGARRGAVAAPGTQALCLAQLALLALDEDDWIAGETLVMRARAQVERFGLIDYPHSALVYAISAALRAHRGRVDEATIDLRRATGLAARLCDPAPWFAVEVQIALAQAALRLSDVGSARELLEAAARLVRWESPGSILCQRLERALIHAESVEGQASAGRWSLTTAELRLLQFLPTHLSYPQIAGQLNVSANTVKTHARAVYRKLDSSSRAEAVAQARSAGLVEADATLAHLATAA